MPVITPYLTTYSTTSTSTASVWYYWQDQGTATSATTYSIWGNWVAVGGATAAALVRPAPPPKLVLTPEQIASENARREAQERKWAAERAARKLAEETAQELLLTHLTAIQKQMVKDKQFFVVEGGKSKDKYRIWTHKGVHGNIERLNKEGKAVANLCVQLNETVCPNGDHFLAQKLMLELAEEEILKVANVSRLAA